MEDFYEYIDLQEDELNVPNRLPKRYIRNEINPLDQYSTLQFQKRYRFSKHVVENIILPQIQEGLEKVNNRGLPIRPIDKLLLTLRFYATGNFQLVDGDLRGLSQSSASVTVKEVSVLLANMLHTNVKFPANENAQRENVRKFYTMFGFPSVAGCVDGTHIPIQNPGGANGEVFRNRKGIFSLNVQVIAGPSMEILDIVVRHPGSTHDSVIFNRSAARLQFEENRIIGILLGDSAYPCRPYLLTPVLNPANQAERNYNAAHINTRNVVERLFGKWKRRFPCLSRVLRTKLETTQAIICACAFLYNLALEQDDEIELDEENDPQNLLILNNDIGNRLGSEFRRQLIEQHFQ